MNRRDLADVIDFALILRGQAPELHMADVRNAVLKLRGHARTLHRYSEQACNREMSDRERKRGAMVQAAVLKIVADLGPGFGAVFGSDPRGAPLFLTVPSGYTNDWGQRGVVVPY